MLDSVVFLQVASGVVILHTYTYTKKIYKILYNYIIYIILSIYITE